METSALVLLPLCIVIFLSGETNGNDVCVFPDCINGKLTFEGDTLSFMYCFKDRFFVYHDDANNFLFINKANGHAASYRGGPPCSFHFANDLGYFVPEQTGISSDVPYVYSWSGHAVFNLTFSRFPQQFAYWWTKFSTEDRIHYTCWPEYVRLESTYVTIYTLTEITVNPLSEADRYKEIFDECYN